MPGPSPMSTGWLKIIPGGRGLPGNLPCGLQARPSIDLGLQSLAVCLTQELVTVLASELPDSLPNHCLQAGGLGGAASGPGLADGTQEGETGMGLEPGAMQEQGGCSLCVSMLGKRLPQLSES